MLPENCGINGNLHESRNKPSFKLHFHRNDIANGRSTVRVPKNDENFVTPKISPRRIETKHIYDVNETGKATIDEDTAKHRDLCHWPLLNSERLIYCGEKKEILTDVELRRSRASDADSIYYHSYGWWYDHSKVAKEIDESPYDWPLLSSESYGWWYDRAFSSRESRFDHHIRDPTLVHSSEIIHWQDQKLFGLGHSSYA